MTVPEIARLKPFDGMFLRAIHLQQIQLYTQALTRALGRSGGPGVVHGYGLTLASASAPGELPTMVAVQPGLAVDGDGRILLSTMTIYADLPADGDDVAWRVVLVATEEPFGSEKSYGDLCVDPCAGDSGSAPFVGERVEVRLLPLALPALDTTSAAFRNRVASWYFEQERRDGGPLILASDRDPADDQGKPITGVEWAAPTGPGPGPVELGLLLRTADGFVLDVWAARRDRVQTPPETGWTNRLAMRPWQVFIAQLLQFQDQLDSAWPGSPSTATSTSSLTTSVSAEVSKELAEALHLMKTGQTRQPSAHLKKALAALAGKGTGTPALSLEQLGFEELPPAGYLPIRNRQISGPMRELFREGTHLVFNAYRADTIVELVARAQHADRIPLGRGTRIEIMVPVADPYTDGDDLQTTRSWVAFRRAVHNPLCAADTVDRTGGTPTSAEAGDAEKNALGGPEAGPLTPPSGPAPRDDGQ